VMGCLPLHHTCTNRTVAAAAIVKAVLHAAPQAIGMTTNMGELPLHLACAYSHSAAAVEALIAAYPEATTVRTNVSKLPIDYAIINDSFAMADIKALVAGAMEAARAQAEAELLALYETESTDGPSTKRKKKSKTKKGKKKVAAAAAGPESLAVSAAAAVQCVIDEPGHADPPEQVVSDTHTEDTQQRVQSNNTLQVAMEARDLQQLNRELEYHSATADATIVKQATTLRKELKQKQRKLRLKVEKASNNVRNAMDAGTDTVKLAEAIFVAESLLQSPVAGESGGLAGLLVSARTRLEAAKIEQHIAQKQASIENVEQEFVALAMSRHTTAAVAAVGGASAEDADRLCVVCLAEPKTFVFTPCGHMCVCSDCADLVLASNRLCPMCRNPSEGKLRVFI